MSFQHLVDLEIHAYVSYTVKNGMREGRNRVSGIGRDQGDIGRDVKND
ncbi:MAG: hypothetical protein OIF54_17445 [Cohaesibacter sp.]|nr:hypothetical protein [Cohaesibacter sp.]